jgi:predicted esterase
MLIINNQKNPRILVIWLHGLGANSHDFKEFIEMLGMDDMEFILPDAPLIPITLNQGLKMQGWYDIKSLEHDEHDIEGLKKSTRIVKNIIEERCKQSKEKLKICLVGFSQGAALSLFFLLNSSVKLDGVISLSGYIPDKVKKTIIPKIPILALHGIHDDIIKVEYAKESYKILLKEENFRFVTFNMGHEVIFEEIQYIKKFLMRI